MTRSATYLICITFIYGAGCCYSQSTSNILLNGSFEELRDTTLTYPCPTSPGQISKAKYWKSAYGSVDYFNACSNNEWPNFGVTNNIYGQQSAAEGSAYALILGYVNYPGYEDSREFLWTELPDTLRRGQGYYWKIQVSLADSMNFALARLGALFTSENTRFWQKDDFFNAIPQIENPFDSLLDDKLGWISVAGNFVAMGGEKYLTIGFFNRDADENLQRVSNFPNTTTLWEQSAYYLDAVVLREDNTIGIAEDAAVRTTLYPNPSNGENVMLEYAAKKGGQLQWEITDMVGRAVHVQPLQGMEGRAVLGTQLTAGIYISSVTVDGVRGAGQRLVIQ